MARDRTNIVVVGAGASREFGLPTGEGLKDVIKSFGGRIKNSTDARLQDQELLDAYLRPEGRFLPHLPCYNVLPFLVLENPSGASRPSLYNPPPRGFHLRAIRLHPSTRYTKTCIIDPCFGARLSPGLLRPPLCPEGL